MSGIKFSRGLRFPLAAILALTLGLVWTSFAMADAGNPILNTMRGTVVPTNAGPNEPVTVYVRGQWDWLSHGGDCNQFPASPPNNSPGFTQANRAGTGVAMMWNDPNGGTAASNEVQRISRTQTGNFTLKWKNPSGTQTNTGTLSNASSAQQVEDAMELAWGAGDFDVTGLGTTASPWTVTFVGDFAGLNVNPIQRNNGISLTFSSTDGNAAAFNGYALAGTAIGPGGTDIDITAYLGTKTATTTTQGTNVVDGLIHPVDRGNVPEGYTTAGTDYPGGQQFVDPTPVASGGDFAAAKAAWRAGCGRMPLSATSTPKTGTVAGPESTTPLRCGSGAAAGQSPDAAKSNGDCAGEPWGSWGYEKVSGANKGYSHYYAKRSDLTSICVNFYDQHGSAQISSSSLDVLGNGDNSLGTNRFNLSQGANCLFFPQIITTASDAVVGGNIHDSASLTGVPANAGGTLIFSAYKRADPAVTGTCAGAGTFTSAPIPVTGPGTYGSGDFDTGIATAGAGTYDWKVVYSGSGGIQSVTTVCGDESGGNDEVSDVAKQPTTVTTNAGPTLVLGFAAGSNVDLTDSATLSGGLTGALKPTGTITFSLWRNDSACTPGGEFPGTPHTKPVNNGNATYTSNAINTTQAGTYRWIANYSGDDNHSGTTNGCNGDNENVLVIRPEIDVTKNPKQQSVPSGTLAHFIIEVTNTGDTRLNNIVIGDALAPGCGRTAAQTAPLIDATYDPANTGHTFLDPTESFTYNCDSDPVTAPFTNVVTACGAVVLTPPGGTVCDDDDTGLDPNCPEPARCGGVTISDLTTKQDLRPRDTGTLSGLVGTPGGTLTFNLFRNSNTCAAASQLDLDLADATTKSLTATVNANGSYTVESASLLSQIIASTQTNGTYYWQVSYSGNGLPTPNAAITGACGTENFTIDND